MDELQRCPWAIKSERERQYHDNQWGVPLHDDKALFKMLILEGQQAGLSWSTILSKMEALCRAYDDFDPALLASYDEAKIEALLQTEGIIKNRRKVRAAVGNAKAYFMLCKEWGSLDRYLWAFVGGAPVVNAWEKSEDVPVTTPLAQALSKDLKKRGFSFVGPVIVYSFMQAVGMVNDHLTTCSFYRP